MRVDYSQAEARAQRHKGYLAHYLAFDVVAEVRDRCDPLAAEIAGMGVKFKDQRAADELGQVLIEPGFRVVQVASAVHQLRLDLIRLLARRGSAEVRGRLSAVVSDRATGVRPVIDNDGLRSGTWVDALVAHVEPLRVDLAELVAGRPAGVVDDVDAALTDALRGPQVWDGLDQTVRDLERRVEYLHQQVAAHARARRAFADLEAERERNRAAADLQRLGLRA
jgi:hypothetical protein